MKPRVIITAPTHPMLEEGLRERGFEVDVREKISYGDLSEVVGVYEGMIVSTRLNGLEGWAVEWKLLTLSLPGRGRFIVSAVRKAIVVRLANIVWVCCFL
jgi:hypothetical protein